MVPAVRIRPVNEAPMRGGGDYVLYWMIAARRARSNFGLQRAVEHAVQLGKPLVVLEALSVGHRWASARFHQFVVDGMRDNAAAFQPAGVAYYPYLEQSPGAGRGLLAALAARAAVVVTDDYPCFALPRMVAAAGAALGVALEAVDSNGLLPLRAVSRVYPTAYTFRRALQGTLGAHLPARPEAAPLARLTTRAGSPMPDEVHARWPSALTWLDSGGTLQSLPIDHRVRPVAGRGGSVAAHRRLAQFLAADLARYGTERNHPDRDGSSQLSPYLHWGHIGVHEIAEAVLSREGWMGDVPDRGNGAKQGWWGVSPSTESFLDELVTWRELGFNFTAQRDDYDRYESLPAWAQQTLEAHRADEREFVYDLDDFECARTHDPLWNAAQRQLTLDGRIHNYLRMLWGKKILEWSTTPQAALSTMVELNNKYALDGRDPNSYSGIFWVLGRYDRPWYPERPVFGVVRYMSSGNAGRKLRLKDYVRRYGGESVPPSML